MITRIGLDVSISSRELSEKIQQAWPRPAARNKQRKVVMIHAFFSERRSIMYVCMYVSMCVCM